MQAKSAVTTEQAEGGKSKTFWYWLVGLMVLSQVVLGMSYLFGPRPDASWLCHDLIWPASSSRRKQALEGKRQPGEIIVERPLGSGDQDYGRAQLTADTWKKTPGIEEASSWPGVSFRVSQAALLDGGKEPARVIRAVSGNRMGLWIFGQSGKDMRSDIFVAHPGGNSQTPFQTTFVWKQGVIAVINLLPVQRNRAENFLFRLGDDKVICRAMSER